MPSQSNFAHVRQIRTSQSDGGTPGIVKISDSFFCRSLELPDRNNAQSISRIPPAVYVVEWRESARFGWAYTILNVVGRTHILFHVGNWAGDESLDYKSDSYGCPLLGNAINMGGRQPALVYSRAAIRRFEDALGHRPFTLSIEEDFS